MAGLTRRDPYVWDVALASAGALAGALLRPYRLLPDGRSVKFDEDPALPLNLETGQDEALLRDGVLALLPDGSLLSCVIRVTGLSVMLSGSRAYRQIYAGPDKQAALRALESNGLYNSDGASGDALLIGGSGEAHRSEAVIAWAGRIEREILGQIGPTGWLAPWAPLLEEYDALIYTVSGEIILAARSGTLGLAQIRDTLAEVGAHYGFALPD
jgi:hypothetical protein